jgi:DNA topoisomerase II
MSVKSISNLNKYQRKTDKQHILDNPDTYIGSVEIMESDEFILNKESDNIEKVKIQYNPGLYKLFDEGVVNCRDHVIRMQQAINDNIKNSIPVTFIDINIDDNGIITMINDGNGIDIAEHPEYKIWIPELIFGHLRTSTNYDKTEKKIVGGKNGFGFKLVLIWSTWGSIETVDHTRKLKYIQEFHNNLDIIDKPTIAKIGNTKPYTKIQFKPDYKRLGLVNGLTPDMLSLFRRRVYDIAAVTNKSIKVKLNSEIVPIKNFQQYIKLISKNNEIKYEEANDRWEYAIGLAQEGEFHQISFVNGIYTSKGGKHIEYIMNQIVRKLATYIKTKKKIEVKASSIKEQLVLFLRCDIENPTFDSQTKDFMNTLITKFGSSCTVSDKFIEKIAKMGVMDAACAINEIKENKSLQKTDGIKNKTIRGIPKLIDANFAGTAKSNLCSLILCEGDSAKAGIVSGLSKEDRNIIGIYPMKGKMFNVRGESITKIGDNKEIYEIKQILGLEHGKDYTMEDVKTKLRYSKILFMTDQDLDGSHIKGLGINLFEFEWKSLLEIPEFIGYMNTPILKAEKGKICQEFYNEGEFDAWKKDNDIKTWRIKYYKGLGTSTAKEFKEYFAKKKIVIFESTGSNSRQMIDMVFNKKRSNDRKTWLASYNRELYLDTSKPTITYEEFINNDLIHFSKYDNDRSIPNLVDGLKISLRKIIFSAFKKKLTNEIKVAQFSGYVSEQSGYHHGEASLNGAIIGLAQNFVGSNNINLLEPNGQFGTRLLGGKDSASERYIFTQLNKLTRLIYPMADDPILTYVNDDGMLVEPIYYVPIIPMILVNGSKGIGTGFSTDIMCYNPLQIINKLELMLNKKSHDIDICPYYHGFKGSIELLSDNKKYIIKGTFEIINATKIRITELPIGTWTEDYKVYLETLTDTKKKDKNYVKDFTDMSTDTSVDFTIEFYYGGIKSLMEKTIDLGDSNKISMLEKLLKLYTIHSITNMHLFDANECLKKYNTASEIIEEYYGIRLAFYDKRKKYQMDKIEKELIILSNKARYINDNLSGKIDLRRKKKDEITKILNDLKYDALENTDDVSNFNYLIKMPMDSVSDEAVEKLMKEEEQKENELTLLTSLSIEDMWLIELDELKKEYIKYCGLGQKKITIKKKLN